MPRTKVLAPSRLAGRIDSLEGTVNNSIPIPEQELAYLFQGTQFAKMAGVADGRIYDPSAPSSIDEETQANVVAYATFDDIGGNGTATLLTAGAAISDSFTAASFTTLSFADAFLTPEYKIPLLDGEGRTAYYRGHFNYLNWSPHSAPDVIHTKQFLAGHSFELNVPGTNAQDIKSYAYYDSHANFNVSSNISVSLWFYPTDWSSLSGQTFRYLLYRYIDASNYFIVNIDALDSTHLLRVFVREGGTETKLKDNVGNNVVLNSWNLVNFTYNPTSNALVLYVNGTSFATATSTALSPPYTTDTNMYIGGLPGLTDNRFTGYMDNFVMWSGKILTAGEVTNMWTRGTIV
jgi:hypothetical protein